MKQGGSPHSCVLVHPSAQLDLPLLGPGEANLVAQHPVDLGPGDHPGAEALEEQLASGHRLVTGLLHRGSPAALPWGGLAQ
jgi:hypothetical protein